jgi:hypothetical protein
MQLVMSLAVLAIGLFLAFFADASGDMRVFGWVLVGVGALGLVLRSMFRTAGRGRSR